jgi:hypothetical protein
METESIIKTLIYKFIYTYNYIKVFLMKQVLHYPRLDTVLMIEETLKKTELAISKSELSRRLPKKVMRQTLNVVLDYLEEKGVIMIGKKGVLWVHNESPKMKRLLQNSQA